MVGGKKVGFGAAERIPILVLLRFFRRFILYLLILKYIYLLIFIIIFINSWYVL